MKGAAWFFGGFALGVFVIANLKQANESNCCARVAIGARDTIAGAAGPAKGIVAGALDALGLTKHLPSILDGLGVPLDA